MNMVLHFWATILDICATILFFSCRSDEALRIANRAVRLRPGSPILWMTKIQCEISLKRFDDALKSSDTILELEKNHLGAMSTKAAALGGLGQITLAREIYSRILGRGDLRPEFRKYITKCLDGLDDSDNGREV